MYRRASTHREFFPIDPDYEERMAELAASIPANQLGMRAVNKKLDQASILIYSYFIIEHYARRKRRLAMLYKRNNKVRCL